MVSLLRWLIGFVRFRFAGGFADGFLNDCKNARLGVKNLHYEQDVLIGECLPQRYLRVCRMAKRHGGTVRIVKKAGAFFPLLKIRHRMGLLAGAVLFAAVVSTLTGCIWQIEITGNDRIGTAQVRAVLEECGLREGARWRDIQKDDVSSLLLAAFPDCAWAHVNEIGTVARVEINEGTPPPEMADTTGVANVRAKRDGVLVRTDVRDGWAVAQKGDSVVKGDLLISGIYDGEKEKGNQFTHASGVCLAQVALPFRLTVSRVQSGRVPTAQKTYRTLRFFHLKIPLYVGKKQVLSATVTTETAPLTLCGTALPVCITKDKVQYYTTKKRVLTDKELLALCQAETKKKISADYSDSEVLKKQLRTTLNADDAQIRGTLICLQDIAEEVPVKIKHQKKSKK